MTLTGKVSKSPDRRIDCSLTLKMGVTIMGQRQNRGELAGLAPAAAPGNSNPEMSGKNFRESEG